MIASLRTTSEDAATRPRSRWRRRLILLAVFFVALVYFLPAIVAKTFLFDKLLANATSDLKGTIRVGGASLGWFSGVELRDVELRDANGAVVASLSSVRGSKSLLGLLRNSRDLGEFHVIGADIKVVSTERGTNLESIFAAYLDRQRDPSAKPSRPVRLGLSGERIHLTLEEPAIGRSWNVAIEPLALGLNATTGESLALSVRGTVTGEDRSGEWKLDLKSVGESTSGTVASKSLPLDLFEPFLKRFDPSTVLHGKLEADLEFVVNAKGEGAANGRVGGSDLVLSGSFFRDDRLALKSLEIPCRVRSEGGKLFFEQFAVRSDLGSVGLSGSVPLNGDRDQLARLDDTVLTVDLDLARIASQLPNTVRLQSDTRLTSGRLSATLKSVRENGQILWRGDLTTTNLRGKSRGREIVWDQPLTVEFAARPQPNGLPRIDKLRCQSDSVLLTATSGADSITLDGRCDLDRFRERVSQWIDLGAFDVGGEATVRLVGTRREADGFQLKGEATFQQSRLVDVNGTNRQADSVRVELNVAGAAPQGEPIRLTGGGVTVQAAGDGLGLYIVEPIPDLAKLDRGGLRLILRGQLERWQARFAPWVAPLREFRTAGPVDLALLTKFDPDGVKLVDVDAKLGEAVPGREVRFVGYGIDLQEPTLKLKSSGVLRRSTGRMALGATDFETPTLKLKLASIDAGNDAKGDFQLHASGSASGDLARLQKWFQRSPIPVEERVQGVASGKVGVGITNGAIKLDVDLRAENSVVGNPANPLWRDPKLTLSGRVELDPATSLLRLTGFRVQGTGVGGTADGTISKWTTSRDVALTGELRYDLEKLEPQLRSVLGPQLVARGNETRAFKVEGSLASGNVSTLVQLNGEGGLGWRELKCFGADIGSANLAFFLKKGWIALPPVETSMNQGKLKLAVGVRLDPGPSELVFYPGTTVDRAVVTPRMCADALGYVAPALAKAAEAEGTFSMTIDSGRVPLGRPESGDLAGRITLHSVRVGPGPLLKELSVLSNNPNSITLAKEQVVPFRMVNGRVHHENLKLSFPELTITTSGSVGLDGTLDLVAEMPIPPKWLGKTPLTVSLAKQTLRLPINGTLSQPKLNEQALRNLVAQFARDTAKDFLKEELEKKFQKLIRP